MLHRTHGIVGTLPSLEGGRRVGRETEREIERERERARNRESEKERVHVLPCGCLHIYIYIIYVQTNTNAMSCMVKARQLRLRHDHAISLCEHNIPSKRSVRQMGPGASCRGFDRRGKRTIEVKNLQAFTNQPACVTYLQLLRFRPVAPLALLTKCGSTAAVCCGQGASPNTSGPAAKRALQLRLGPKG